MSELNKKCKWCLRPIPYNSEFDSCFEHRNVKLEFYKPKLHCKNLELKIYNVYSNLQMSQVRELIFIAKDNDYSPIYRIIGEFYRYKKHPTLFYDYCRTCFNIDITNFNFERSKEHPELIKHSGEIVFIRKEIDFENFKNWIELSAEFYQNGDLTGRRNTFVQKIFPIKLDFIFTGFSNTVKRFIISSCNTYGLTYEIKAELNPIKNSKYVNIIYKVEINNAYN